MKIGFIGGGNMAEAMVKGIWEQGKMEILVSEPKGERARFLQETYGIETTQSNADVVNTCSFIVLAVKPQNMEEVLNEIGASVSDEQTVMSIAAGITLDYLTSKINTNKIIRVMPNTPALVQEGMSVMSLCDCFADEGINVARDILMSIGKVITLPEKHINAVTALSGSGPAFIALFIESLIKGGVALGLSEYDAQMLAVQTALGTSKLLDTGMNPSKLREMVTSPGGTTAAGLKVFEDRGFQDIIINAMVAAENRAKELGKGR
ncbi:MAG: pyrroline-5-carboxylate reductase [Nitrospiraceae bacterium]|nr:MAG: pyrroline-5-carboxylate reductase [Nitrospiraceae bacterium]